MPQHDGQRRCDRICRISGRLKLHHSQKLLDRLCRLGDLRDRADVQDSSAWTIVVIARLNQTEVGLVIGFPSDDIDWSEIGEERLGTQQGIEMLGARHVAGDLVLFHNDKVQSISDERGKLSRLRDQSSFTALENLKEAEAVGSISIEIRELGKMLAELLVVGACAAGDIPDELIVWVCGGLFALLCKGLTTPYTPYGGRLVVSPVSYGCAHPVAHSK